jgi:hypothetical protein
VSQTIEDLEAHRQSIIAHLATVEDCIRDETQLLEILKELALALALDELAELAEEEVADESI